MSAMFPRNAAPMPAIPKASPKNRPEIAPTLPGTNSCAKTRIAENADDKTTPIITDNTAVQNNPTNGSNMVNGATPNIDHQITLFRPTLSPIGPPTMVPIATANKNANK